VKDQKVRKKGKKKDQEQQFDLIIK
jgi:hypothetical protein